MFCFVFTMKELFPLFRIRCIFWLILFNIMAGAVSVNKSPPDPSVPDNTDMSLIDEFLNSQKSQVSGPKNPNRGSLEHEKTTTSSTKTSVLSSSSTTPPTTSSGNEKRTESGEPCKCVKYYFCEMEDQSNATDIANDTDILGVVDIRGAELKNSDNSAQGNTSLAMQCDSYFDVCCALKNVKEGNETGTQQESQATTTPRPQWQGHKSCGHRNENGVGFTMTGATQNEAQFGEFPWTAALIQMEKNEDNVTIHKYIGGGSLLHPQVILTVAHNVLGKNHSTLKVRLGEWDTQTNDEPFPSQDRGVQKVIVHEHFLLKTLYNDVALLILDEEIRFAPNVDTICLPPLNIKKPTFDGQICYSAGWGKDHFGAEGRYSEIMKKVAVPIVPKDKCQSDLSKSEKLPGFRLDKSFVCAGGSESGDDTCKGDGGSALVCALPDQAGIHYVQVGAVAWGLGCGSTIYPGVYTDIKYMTPWILKTMEKAGMSSEYCTASL